MQRSRVGKPKTVDAVAGSILVLLTLAPALHAASGDDGAKAGGRLGSGLGTQISGVVRDADGVAQMGALVQLLGSNAMVAGATFTDSRGRYVIAHVLPGIYRLRASSTLLVPSTRSNLKLNTGDHPVVNLTLSALFDAASWLPATRRRADEPDDNWKWTLRSHVNRPLLRVLEQEEQDGAGQRGTVARDALPPRVTRFAVTTVAADEFGRAGLAERVRILSEDRNGQRLALRVEGGSPSADGQSGSSLSFVASAERSLPIAGGNRTEVSFRSNPELTAAGRSGVRVIGIRTAEAATLGERVEFEVGSALTAVQADGRTGWASQPFIRVSAHPGEGWRVQYAMATARGTESYQDLEPGVEALPSFAARSDGPKIEHGRHQELSVSHRSGRATVEVAYFHDALEDVAISGVGGDADAGGGAQSPFEGMVVDRNTGQFRTLATGYTADGARVTLTTPLTSGVWLAAEYTSGEALVAEQGAPMAPGDSGSPRAGVTTLAARRTQAASIAVKAKIAATGTRVRTAYRWQPADRVTAADPYGSLSDAAFLSLFVRQSFPHRAHLPKGLSGTVDITNLLAQGYRPFVSADGRVLYLAQSPRTLQAGLSLNF